MEYNYRELTASQPFTSALIMSNPKMFKYCWVWEKQQGTSPLLSKKQPMKVHEDLRTISQIITARIDKLKDSK